MISHGEEYVWVESGHLFMNCQDLYGKPSIQGARVVHRAPTLEEPERKIIFSGPLRTRLEEGGVGDPPCQLNQRRIEICT